MPQSLTRIHLMIYFLECTIGSTYTADFFEKALLKKVNKPLFRSANQPLKVPEI